MFTWVYSRTVEARWRTAPARRAGMMECVRTFKQTGWSNRIIRGGGEFLVSG